MQEVYTFLGTDQCQLLEYDPYSYICKKENENVQEEPQAEAAANPRYQEEEKKSHRLTCV